MSGTGAIDTDSATIVVIDRRSSLVFSGFGTGITLMLV